MQIHRLFEIVYLLLHKNTMTARELAERFEVSTRTILRDIQTLIEAHIPIYATQGKGGGISILDGFVLNKTALTQEEQGEILLGLKSLSASGHVQAQGALSKLSALFQRTDADWIEVDFSRWGQGEQDNRRFELLKYSILHKTAVTFRYVNTQGDISERAAYPLKLVFKSKAWYLQAYCTTKQDYRTFKITRMLDIRATDDSFAHTPLAPPPIENSAPVYQSLIELELVFNKHVASRVYDEFDEGSIERDDDGSVHVCTRLPEDNWLYSFLYSFGSDVVVLKPAHVATGLAKKTNSIQ